MAEGEQRPVTVALVEDDDGVRRTCFTEVTTITGGTGRFKASAARCA